MGTTTAKTLRFQGLYDGFCFARRLVRGLGPLPTGIPGKARRDGLPWELAKAESRGEAV